MDYDAKKRECETREYKKFMKVAKRISYLQYGKWTINPNVNDPLRKFTLEKDTGWFTIKVGLYMEQFYHRSVYDDGRYDYRAKIQVEGAFGGKRDTVAGMLFIGIPLNLNMKLKPRMAKKLIVTIDEVLIPKIYQEIEKEKEIQEQKMNTDKEFKDNLAKVPSLNIVSNRSTWDRAIRGNIIASPFTFVLEKDHVTVDGRMTYDQLATMVRTLGWGK